jgi:hypothetical protein
MRILLVIFFFYLTADSFSQAPPIADSIAKRLNITRVIRTFKYNDGQSTFTDYYDRNGRIIKSQAIPIYLEKTVTSNKYDNDLLINSISKTYDKKRNKLVEIQKAIYTYNGENKLTGSTTVSNGTTIHKDTTIYNTALNIDTIYSYSNDTSISNPERRSFDAGVAKNMHIQKVTINYYDSNKNKLRQVVYSYRDREGCKNNHHRQQMTDSTGYTISEFYTARDTTFENITIWHCTMGKWVILNKSVNISRKEIYQEYWGDTIRIVDQLNELNLIATRKINRIPKLEYNAKSEVIVTYQYFFDRKR